MGGIYTGAILVLYVYFPPSPVGILYIGVRIIFILLLVHVFRMILNKDWVWIVWNLFTIFIWPLHINFLSL